MRRAEGPAPTPSEDSYGPASCRTRSPRPSSRMRPTCTRRVRSCHRRTGPRYRSRAGCRRDVVRTSCDDRQTCRPPRRQPVGNADCGERTRVVPRSSRKRRGGPSGRPRAVGGDVGPRCGPRPIRPPDLACPIVAAGARILAEPPDSPTRETVAAAVRHELRHAEQWFRMAQLAPATGNRWRRSLRSCRSPSPSQRLQAGAL